MPSMTRAEARLRGADRPHGGAQRRHGGDRARDHRWRGLRLLPRRHRVPADRGPGLSARERAVAGRRLAGAHPAGARPGDRDRAQARRGWRRWSPSPGCRRSTTARRSPMRGVAYIILKHWSERGAGRGSPLAVPRPQSVGRRHRGGTHPRAAAAADPGRRQRAPAPPCRSNCATRASISPSCRRRSTPSSPMRRPSRACSACRRRSAPACRNTPSTVDRVKTETLQVTTDQVFSGARRLSRLELCRPVQQVRPRVPDLRAGRFAVPPAAGGHRQPHGAQQAPAT